MIDLNVSGGRSWHAQIALLPQQFRGNDEKILLFPTLAMTLLSATAAAAEPGAVPMPQTLAALKGCWKARGDVMEKPVSVTINARPILHDAMFALDAESSAVADHRDRYAAHLIFGGAETQAEASIDAITCFWADSFGGTASAVGSGESVVGGFDIKYQDENSTFINRWRTATRGLTWQITARDAKGKENPFASYTLSKVPCPTPLKISNLP